MKKKTFPVYRSTESHVVLRVSVLRSWLLPGRGSLISKVPSSSPRPPWEDTRGSAPVLSGTAIHSVIGVLLNSAGEERSLVCHQTLILHTVRSEISWNTLVEQEEILTVVTLICWKEHLNLMNLGRGLYLVYALF